MTETSRKKALITGVTGQDGSYLAELLLQKEYEVWGVVRRTSSFNTGRIQHLLPSSGSAGPYLQLCYGDLSDASSLTKVLRAVRPDEIYNLGAQSHVRVSFEMPAYTADVTGLGAVRLLESIRELGLDAKFYQASSSELFGKASETPQRETTPFHPRSPYAAAKAFAFYITRNYRESYGMFAVNGILFNHESPRRGENFVTRKISLAAARIRHGQQQTLRLGNLEARRDWGFAGDYVEAIWLMLQSGEPDDFVIATGKSHSVRDFCDLCFAEIGMPLRWEGSGEHEKGIDAEGKVRVEIDPALLRPAEPETLLGDASRGREKLGWQPRVGVAELAKMMVQADLQFVLRANNGPDAQS